MKYEFVITQKTLLIIVTTIAIGLSAYIVIPQI